jgi:tetratricopeptide (TPR) repeat protein
VPVDRDKVLQAAQKLVEKKRYDKAIVELQKLVADDPKDVRTLLKIGDLHLKLEQYVDAITTYERVGQFYSLQGFALKAIAVYKQIREIIHKHVPHLEDRFGHIVPRLAEIYTQLGLTSDALAAYDEVATRLQRAGRDRDAIDIFKKVVDLDPSNPLPYLRLAEAFVRVKDVDNAIQRFGSAAEILLKLGRRDDTLRVVEKLLQIRLDAKFARMAAEIYLDRGQANDGMAALTKLQISFKENPKDLETLALLARAFDKLGQPAKAVEVLKESARIAREGGKADAFNALVATLLSRAPHDDGVKQLVAQRTVPPNSITAPSSIDARRSIEVELSEEVSDVVMEDDIEPEAPFALERREAATTLDPTVQIKQTLAQAEQFRRARDYARAVGLLEAAIHQQPSTRELREKVSDILIEAGDQAGAIRQMLSFAEHLSLEGDVEGAARVLDEILLLEPGQPDAVQMLGALGYAVPSDGYVAGSQYSINEYGEAYQQAGDGYDPNAPLPSYDLEEVSADEMISLHTVPPAALRAIPAPPMMAQPPPLPAPRQNVAQLDDPFANEPPLPSFPIDDAPTPYAAPPASAGGAPRPPPPLPAYPPPSERPGAPAVFVSPRPRRPGLEGALDEDALEEVEFFASHAMFDEARAILDEQLSRLPNHPLLLERKRELEALAIQVQESQSGTRAMPRSDVAPEEDRSFDIAASLDALDALDALPARPMLDSDPRQVSVEAVFEQFKAGVAAQISESDAATHYDLGVAYREMGLYTDAITEFELASRDPRRECVCWSMIGSIHLQMNNLAEGIDALLRALTAQDKTSDQELHINYEIGNAYELRNTPDQALYYFQLVARIDPNYRDPRGAVRDRITRLAPAPKPPTRAAVGAELLSDEFDAAFDELLGGGKLP